MTYQIMAMARYEMLIQWRRGSLRIITAGLIVLPLVYMVAARDTFLTSNDVNQVPADIIYHLNTSMMILCTLPLLATILVAIPIMLTEIIPFDRQYHVQDTLWALPLPYRTYLLGKIAGTWLGLTLALLLASTVIGLAGLALIGSFDFSIWLSLWAGGVLLFTLFAAGLSVLLAAGLPNRRRAILVGLLLVGVVVMAFVQSSLGKFYMYVLSSSYARSLIQQGFSDIPVILTLSDALTGSAGLLVAALFAWGWLRWQVAR